MNSLSNNGSVLLITKQPAKVIHDYFEVGKHTQRNHNELAGLLIGFDHDVGNGKVQSIVTHFLPIETCVSTPSYLEWSATEDIRLQRQFKGIKESFLIRDAQFASKLRILGWIHSHPNGLPVFLSGTDMDNIRLHFNSSIQFSVVLNPHTEWWKAYLGPQKQEVASLMLPVDADMLRVDLLKRNTTKISNQKKNRKKKKKHHGRRH